MSKGAIQSNAGASVAGTASEKASAAGSVGEAISDGKWKLSLLSAKTYTEVGGEYFKDKPEDGEVFLVLFFEAENVSGKDDYFNYFYVNSYVDGYEKDVKVLLTDVDKNSTLVGDVAAGKRLKGCLAWTVPKNWSEFEFNYKELGGSKITFTVTPADLSK